MAITDGLERLYDGSIHALVLASKALTLMTPLGAEVQVVPKRELDDGLWEGEVLRAATSPDAPPVGSIVYLHLDHVQGGTL